MRLPDFVGIGTQKGGTTSLHMLLSQDARIGLPKKKELHYFDQEKLKDIEEYAREFEDVSERKVIGEITPYYMFHPKAAGRIKQTMPNAKIIALLRDPVERTISQYFHAKRSGYEDLDIEDALKKENERLLSGSGYSHQKHSYIHRSMYESQLEAYEKLFPTKNLLIIKSEDMFIATDKVWGRIESLLGLNHSMKKRILPKANSGRGESREVSTSLRAELRILLNPTYVAMKEKYGIEWN